MVIQRIKKKIKSLTKASSTHAVTDALTPSSKVNPPHDNPALTSNMAFRHNQTQFPQKFHLWEPRLDPEIQIVCNILKLNG